MPRQGLRHTYPNSPARRCLFGRADPTLNARLEAELNANMNEQSQLWGFDFRNDRPLDAASSSNSFEYTRLRTDEVPLNYRPNILKRKELPNGKVIEVKIFPSGRLPMPSHSPNASLITESSSTPNSSLEESNDESFEKVDAPARSEDEGEGLHQVASLTPTHNPKRRHNPRPAQTPMKLRRRPSPLKTPVSKTPAHTPGKLSPKKTRTSTSTRRLFAPKKC